MNPRRSRPVPAFAGWIAAAFILTLAGCVGAPDLDSSPDPLAVTLDSAGDAAGEASPQRAAAIAEMRSRGEAAETATYPDVFQSAQATRLARREEPRSVAEAETIEAELAAIAARRSAAVAPDEIAALEARAAELRRLAARGQAASLRR